METELTTLNRKFGVNVCGEGGEYETFSLDSPLFRKRLSITSSQTIAHSEDAFAPVFLLSPQCQATDKPHVSLTSSQEELLRYHPPSIDIISPVKLRLNSPDRPKLVRSLCWKPSVRGVTPLLTVTSRMWKISLTWRWKVWISVRRGKDMKQWKMAGLT